MSSSIEEYFQPPEWATKEEVIKAAQHYINYWKIEARQRNQQWLDALQSADNAKRCEESLRGELSRKHKEFAILQSARERDVAEIHRLKAEVDRLTVEADWKTPARKIQALEAEVERLRKAGDAMSEVIQTIDHERFECYPKYRMTTKERNACDAWRAAKEGKQP